MDRHVTISSLTATSASYPKGALAVKQSCMLYVYVMIEAIWIWMWISRRRKVNTFISAKVQTPRLSFVAVFLGKKPYIVSLLLLWTFVVQLVVDFCTACSCLACCTSDLRQIDVSGVWADWSMINYTQKRQLRCGWRSSMLGGWSQLEITRNLPRTSHRHCSILFHDFVLLSLNSMTAVL